MRLNTFDNTRLSEASAATNRPLGLLRPCDCGCDERGGSTKGYLHMIQDGQGFSLHAETEQEYEQLAEMLEVLA